MITADLMIQLERVKHHLRKVLRLLGESPFLMGDKVYHIAAPARELVVINADDPYNIVVRDVDLPPGAPVAHIHYDQLRLWGEPLPLDPDICPLPGKGGKRT